MFKHYRNTVRLFNRDVYLLLLTSALTGVTYTGIYVTLFNLYLLRLGYGPVFIGSINAAAQLGFALFSLPAGAIGGRWDTRKVAGVGLGIAVVSFGILPLAELLPVAWQSGWLMITFIIAWLGGALYLVNSYPLLMSVTGPAERAHAFSFRQAIIPLGTFAGNLTGGFLAELLVIYGGFSSDQPAPYRYVLFGAASTLIIGVIALLSIRGVKIEHSKIHVTAASPMPIGLITFMGLLMLFQVAAQGAVINFFSIYLDDHLHVSTAWIGGLAAIGQLLAVPVTLLTPLATANWGRRQTILVGMWGLAFSLLLLALVPHWAAAGLAFIGATVSFTFVAPALLICQQEIVPAEWRAVMSGTIVTAKGLGTAAIAFGGGHLITTVGYQGLFLTGTALAVLGVAFFWTYTWLPRWLLTHRRIVGSTLEP